MIVASVVKMFEDVSVFRRHTGRQRQRQAEGEGERERGGQRGAREGERGRERERLEFSNLVDLRCLGYCSQHTLDIFGGQKSTVHENNIVHISILKHFRNHTIEFFRETEK